MKKTFPQFIQALDAHGYTPRLLESIDAGLDAGSIYLRHDVKPDAVDAGLRLAELHERLQLAGTFHLTWDGIAVSPRRVRTARRLGCCDPVFVRLGLQTDPISRWLAATRFGGSSTALHHFLTSPEFPSFLHEMLRYWRSGGGEAMPLREVREGAMRCLGESQRSFREEFGDCATISGLGSPLSMAFARARRAAPELAAIAEWFSPVDFLIGSDLSALGCRFEATRFPADEGPGPPVAFGGGRVSELRQALKTRIAGGRGIVTIFPAGYWDGDRYADLLPMPNPRGAPAVAAPVASKPAEPIPDRPMLTTREHLATLGTSLNRAELTTASRRIVGGAIDISFPRFVDWLRAEGYVFAGFENGAPRFGERVAYLRYDVHSQDLMAAYVLADLHERLGLVGSFQITWKFSPGSESWEPHFARLLEFDRRFVQFGLHAAPTATWYLNEKLGGDLAAVRSLSTDAFEDWILELHAAFTRDGDDAVELRQIRSGADDTLSGIAASFRRTFGTWKSVSGHGNFLTSAFFKVRARHREVEVLRPYFNPVDYFDKWGVSRFGFDHETTWFGTDRLPYPRVLWEGGSAEERRTWYRGRVAHGAGFVALLHPANWTCAHNATFFLAQDHLLSG